MRATKTNTHRCKLACHQSRHSPRHSFGFYCLFCFLFFIGGVTIKALPLGRLISNHHRWPSDAGNNNTRIWTIDFVVARKLSKWGKYYCRRCFGGAGSCCLLAQLLLQNCFGCAVFCISISLTVSNLLFGPISLRLTIGVWQLHDSGNRIDDYDLWRENLPKSFWATFWWSLVDFWKLFDVNMYLRNHGKKG